MEWNYLWAGQEQHRERIRRLEESIERSEGEITPPLPDSLRYMLSGFVVGVGLAAALAVSRHPATPTGGLILPAAPVGQPLTLDPAPREGIPDASAPQLKQAGSRRLPASRESGGSEPKKARPSEEP